MKWAEVDKSGASVGQKCCSPSLANILMPTNQIFSSDYTHGVDEKRRVQVPAKWRPDEENAELTLVLWTDMPSQQVCLRVLPPRQVDALMARIEAMSTSDPEAVSLRRNIARNSDQVTLDKVGRICIPDRMAKEAGLGKEVLLLGALQWFEIWNPSRHAAAFAADKMLAPEAVKKI